MKLELYKEIRSYIKTLIASTKFENKTYCVGGCCRDEVLGNDIKDIDIVVELEDGGIELARYLYENHLTKGHVQIYQRYGTAMFVLRKYPDIEIEVVHTRCEKYLDGNSRNPETDYGTIEEDCYRRDLTINALYYNISKEEFCDFCGYSLDHIKNHVICTPCNPNITYMDDPLRILRCVRFATRYGWEIEDKTYLALKNNVHRLCILTAERITDEFMKILSDKNYVHGLNLLEDIDALKYILSPFNLYAWNGKQPPILYAYYPNLMVSSLLDNVNVRLAILLYPYKQYADQIMRMRKLPNNTIKYVISLIKLYDKHHELLCCDKGIRKAQYECGTKDKYDDLLKIIFVMCQYLYEQYKEIYDPNKHNHFGYKLPIDGDDIMEILNCGPSSKVKDILENLLEYSFEFPNITKEDCIKYIKERG